MIWTIHVRAQTLSVGEKSPNWVVLKSPQKRNDMRKEILLSLCQMQEWFFKVRMKMWLGVGERGLPCLSHLNSLNSNTRWWVADMQRLNADKDREKEYNRTVHWADYLYSWQMWVTPCMRRTTRHHQDAFCHGKEIRERMAGPPT